MVAYVAVFAKTSLVCTITEIFVQLVAIFNSYHYTVHKIPILPFLISLLFSRQLLTVCKCGFDMMAPVERTKWMKSTWDCTLGHGCVYWASRLNK